MSIPITVERLSFRLDGNDSGQQLCGSCQSIQLPLHSEFQKHIRGYKELSLRAASCDLCRLIRQGLRREFSATCTSMMDNRDMNWLDNAISKSVLYNNSFCPGFPGWVAICGRESFIDVFVSPRAHCTLILSPEHRSSELDDDELCYFPQKAHNGNPLNHGWLSKQLFFAKDALWNSVSTEGMFETVMPSRVVDVGDHTLYGISKLDYSDTVRLIEPKRGTLGAYVALSHRWSSAPHITTTSNNIGKHRKGIQWQQLSRTFREVIIVCHELGIRYLWIDSLCIIQDDEADWQRESKLMGDIYQNALYTIACHTADNNDEGFLNSTFHKSSVVLPGKDQQAFRLSLPCNFSRDIAQDSAIAWRGWVLQERLLSSRIIHFLPSQIYLETQGNWVLSLETLQYHYLQETPGLNMSFSPTNPRIEIGRQWLQIVTWFSRCTLTREKDKLYALAGIASAIQRQVHDDYFAGIWGFNFIFDLSWVVANGCLTRKPTKARAPTWSWASLDGAVIYPVSEQGLADRDNDGFRFPSDSTNTRFRDQARGQLRRVSEQTFRAHPMWIDQPVALRFIGIPRRLPWIGKRCQGPCTQHLGYSSWGKVEFSEAWHRPVMIAGCTVGFVILDFDCDRQKEQQPLWYLELYTYRVFHCVLIVSKSTPGSNIFQREGLGFLYTSLQKGNRNMCSILEDLNSVEGKSPEEVILT